MTDLCHPDTIGPLLKKKAPGHSSWKSCTTSFLFGHKEQQVYTIHTHIHSHIQAPSLHSYTLSLSIHLRVGHSFQLPICAALTATGSHSSPGAGHTPLQSVHSPSHHDPVSKREKPMARFFFYKANKSTEQSLLGRSQSPSKKATCCTTQFSSKALVLKTPSTQPSSSIWVLEKK